MRYSMYIQFFLTAVSAAADTLLHIKEAMVGDYVPQQDISFLREPSAEELDKSLNAIIPAFYGTLMLLSAMAQVKLSDGLSLYHATIVLNYAWLMFCCSLLSAFSLQLEQNRITNTRYMMFRFIILIHVGAMAAFGAWCWNSESLQSKGIEFAGGSIEHQDCLNLVVILMGRRTKASNSQSSWPGMSGLALHSLLGAIIGGRVVILFYRVYPQVRAEIDRSHSTSASLRIVWDRIMTRRRIWITIPAMLPLWAVYLTPSRRIASIGSDSSESAARVVDRLSHSIEWVIFAVLCWRIWLMLMARSFRVLRISFIFSALTTLITQISLMFSQLAHSRLPARLVTYGLVPCLQVAIMFSSAITWWRDSNTAKFSRVWNACGILLCCISLVAQNELHLNARFNRWLSLGEVGTRWTLLASCIVGVSAIRSIELTIEINRRMNVVNSDENSWSFGQLLPVLVMFVRLVSFVGEVRQLRERWHALRARRRSETSQ